MGIHPLKQKWQMSSSSYLTLWKVSCCARTVPLSEHVSPLISINRCYFCICRWRSCQSSYTAVEPWRWTRRYHAGRRKKCVRTRPKQSWRQRGILRQVAWAERESGIHHQRASSHARVLSAPSQLRLNTSLLWLGRRFCSSEVYRGRSPTPLVVRKTWVVWFTLLCFMRMRAHILCMCRRSVCPQRGHF
jgi:hypothetical protein